MPSQPQQFSTDLRPSRAQIEALLIASIKDRRALQALLDSFQDHDLLSGAPMPDERVVDSQGRYQRANLMNALSRIDRLLRDQILAVLEDLGGVA